MSRICVFMLFVLCATLAVVFCGLAGEAAFLQLCGAGFALFVHSLFEPVKVVVGDEAQLLEIAKLRAQVERQDEEYDKAWRHDLNDKSNVQVLTAEVMRLTAEVETLRTAMRGISSHVDGNIRDTVRDCVNGHNDVQDIYGYCDEIDALIDAAMRKELQP